MYAVAVDDAIPIVTVNDAAAGPFVDVRAVALAVVPHAFLNGAVGPNAAPPPVLLPLSEPPSVLAATWPHGGTEAVRVAELTCESPGVVAIVVSPCISAKFGLLSIPKITLHAQ